MQELKSRRWTKRCKAAWLLLAVWLPALWLTGCFNGEDAQDIKPAAYSPYGSEFALQLAQDHPDRSPGSPSERAAGDKIIEAFIDLGYEPNVTTFSFQNEDAERQTSRNIEIFLPGSGFEDEENREILQRQVIVGAHYDTAIGADLIFPEPEDEEDETSPDEELPSDEEEAESEEEDSSSFVLRTFEPDWQMYDGIHDNASGIGVLMTLARELRDLDLEYDVYLVAFGAGEAGQVGSTHYAEQMTSEAIGRTDVMYCLDGIYAGDKVYAHAGWNSLQEEHGKNYDMRRKLYELTDVFYENELYTQNRFMLYTNQSSYEVTLPAPVEDETVPEDIPDETSEDSEETNEDETRPDPTFIYREWSLHVSDYRPFDDLGIPIVFFDSGDYQSDALQDFRESNNPAFSATEGIIRQTGYDSSELLQEIFDMVWAASRLDADEELQIDRLRQRINNTAFLITEAILKGRSVSPLDMEPEEDDGLGTFFG